MKKKSTLSVVMIIKNEEKRLPACLESIRCIADEIIILDSGSTDDSEKIARRYGAKWLVNTQWKGFGRQRQRAQTHACCDYVFALDADETIDRRLAEEVKKLLSNPVQKDRVFAVRRKNHFFNYPIYRYSWHIEKVVRIYARETYQYHNFEVHESVDTKGVDVVVLPGKMEHITNESVSHFLIKNIRYSADWARDHAGRKAHLYMMVIKSLVTFIRCYLLRGSCFGGGYGLIHAVATANYTFNKYLIARGRNVD